MSYKIVKLTTDDAPSGYISCSTCSRKIEVGDHAIIPADDNGDTFCTGTCYDVRKEAA